MGRLAWRVFFATVLLGVLTAVSAALYHRLGAGWLLSLAITWGTTFYHFAMRLLVGWTVPEFSNPDSPWFRPRSFEPRLYATLRVRRWKNRMPTFLPESFSMTRRTPAQILASGCKAEVVHEIIVVLSFLPVLTIPRFGAAGVFWGTSLASALFDGCFVVMQRFNRPRLQRLARKEVARR